MREIPKDTYGEIAAITHVGPTKGDVPKLQARSSVQEWTGQSWLIVEVIDGPSVIEPTPLDANSFPGQYVGQRVVTA